MFKIKFPPKVVDVAERAVSTALEVFLAALLAHGLAGVTIAGAKTAALAGIAAGVSVVKNVLKQKAGG